MQALRSQPGRAFRPAVAAKPRRLTVQVSASKVLIVNSKVGMGVAPPAKPTAPRRPSSARRERPAGRSAAVGMIWGHAGTNPMMGMSLDTFGGAQGQIHEQAAARPKHHRGQPTERIVHLHVCVPRVRFPRVEATPSLACTWPRT